MPSIVEFEDEIRKLAASFINNADSYNLEIIDEHDLNSFKSKIKQFGIDFATRNSSSKSELHFHSFINYVIFSSTS